MTKEHLGRRIAQAMIVVFIFQIFGRFGGFVVRTLVYREFGTGAGLITLDAYFFAESTIIWALFVIFDKFIMPTFLPLFSSERDTEGDEAAWKFANSFVNILLLVLAGVATVCMIWVPDLVRVIAYQWTVDYPETAARAIRFARIMVPAFFLIALSSFTNAMLISRKQFAFATAGQGVFRFLQAFLFIIAFRVMGAQALWVALAFLLASPARLLTHGVGLRSELRNYRPAIPYWREILAPALRWLAQVAVVVVAVVGLGWVFRDRLLPSGFGRLLFRPLIRQVDGEHMFVVGMRGRFVYLGLFTAVAFLALRGLVSWLQTQRAADKTLMQRLYLLAYPVLMGELVVRIRDVVQDGYATHFEEGLFGAIRYARSVGELPMAIIPLALSLAMFPYLCDMFTQKDMGGLAETVGHALKMIALFFLPLTVITVILRRPVIELLGGEIDQRVLHATALALALYSLSFVFYASEMVLMQTFFSLQNTWVPTLIGACASLGQVGFLYFLFRAMGSAEAADGSAFLGVGAPFVVVALAYPVSRLAKNLVLGTVLHAKLRLFHWRDVVVFLPKVAVVSALTGAATWAAWQGIQVLPSTRLLRFVRLGVPSLVAFATFVAALFGLRLMGWSIAEFDIILDWVRHTGWAKIRKRFGGGGGEA